MQVVFLDSGATESSRYTHQGADIFEYTETVFMDLADRCRHADVIVTRVMPLRREILDYVTRPRHIIVPRQHAQHLVEHDIAEQLEIQVHAVESDPSDWPSFRAAALSVVESLLLEQ